MKIGIITLTGGSNYGNCLQNYATKVVLNNIGADAFSLKTEYDYYFDYSKITRRTLSELYALLRSDQSRLCFKRWIRFNKFRKTFLNKTTKTYSEKNPSKINGFDGLVFGSDQIWNFGFYRNLEAINYYLGNFESSCPKVAYSASLGTDNVPEEYAGLFKTCLSRFAAISMREKRGKEIVDELLGSNVETTVDPTLMLSKEEWMAIARKPKWINDKEKFLLTYFLGESNDSQRDFIDNICQKKSLRKIELSCGYFKSGKEFDRDVFLADPSEFVWLLANCEMVVTDSFHGSVFSVLMDKPFRCFERAENLKSMSSRMDTLFGLFNIQDWCIGNVDEDIDNIFYKDYSKVESVLKYERQKAFDYLKGALGINEA